MCRNEIGMNAGKVWHLLSDNRKWTYEELKEKSGLTDMDLGAALGWLGREDKVEFEQEEQQLYVFLCVNVYIG
ncbi:winged helix-turn-helix domain-containing protein [Bacteroides sp.]